MKYLVDTDWVADYLKGRPEAVQLLGQLANEGLAISLITLGEIYEGIYYGRDVKAHERGFLALLRGEVDPKIWLSRILGVMEWKDWNSIEGKLH
jgi:predicted nucleic acid-binding protein